MTDQQKILLIFMVFEDVVLHEFSFNSYNIYFS